MGKIGLFVGAIALLSVGSAQAAETCPGNPNAIGTSRVLAINTHKLHQFGRIQFAETLPLNDGEIVVTFDDGPIIPYTERVLDELAAECVKATFFIIGENATEAPDILQRVYQEGHSIGSHTESHAHLEEMPFEAAKEELDKGMASIEAALGPGKLSPFFRAPYLETSAQFNTYLRSKGIALWGIDFQANDWLNISADEIVKLAMTGIEQKKKGILLLHDIQPHTAAALPKLFQELKKRNYKIVHVVSEGAPMGDAPKSAAIKTETLKK